MLGARKMMSSYIKFVFYFLDFLLVVSLIGYCVDGHPQCLDSRPPFQTSGVLSFCPDYQEFGCCTLRDEEILQQRFMRIQQSIPASKQDLWTRCSDYAQTLLCQTCSPYAAHLFDSEVNEYNAEVVQRVFPGLCGNHCSIFYQKCSDLVQYYMEEAGSYHHAEKSRLVQAVAQGQAQFCSAISLSDNDYCFPELLTNPVLNGNITIEKITKEGCICMEPIMSHLRNPIFLKNANDGSNRLFVGEQIGLVHIMYRNGSMLEEPFLNIHYAVKTTHMKGDERGLLGMEFHPNYKTNGLLYIYYSTPERSSPDIDHITRIEELRVHPYNPNIVDTSYSRIIMDIYEPWWNHNGGEILFGDDGYLYLFVGDGGKAGDPLNSGQDLFSMLGKVHRIDVDKPDPAREKQYSIPPDNPFADGYDGLPEIYAYGVRNIWRCGKDRGDPKTKHGKGRIICGDVGQGKMEEINLIQKGANYGWKIKEGTIDYCGSCPKAIPNATLTDPIFDYPHAVGKSVTGGHFYRGCESPNFNGFYFYGDFMKGGLFRLTEPKDPNQYRWDNKELTMCGTDWCKPPLISDYATSIISFGEDEDGEVYLLSTSYASATSFSGSVYRLVDPNRRGDPLTCKSAKTATTPKPPIVPETTPLPTQPPTQPPKTNKPNSNTNTNGNTGTDINTGNTVAPGDKRMESYLDYFKRQQRRKSRRRLQQQFKEERENQRANLETYRGTPPPNNPRSVEKPHIQFHGIIVHKCTNKPKFWCSLNRLLTHLNEPYQG